MQSVSFFKIQLQVLSGYFPIILACVVTLLFLYGLSKISQRSIKTQFKVREYDRLRPAPREVINPTHRQRFNKKAKLLIEGFSEEPSAHKILGVPKNATKVQIQKAYRSLMKRYHPDRHSHLSSKDQEQLKSIASKINQAKEELLSAIDSE